MSFTSVRPIRSDSPRPMLTVLPGGLDDRSAIDADAARREAYGHIVQALEVAVTVEGLDQPSVASLIRQVRAARRLAGMPSVSPTC